MATASADVAAEEPGLFECVMRVPHDLDELALKKGAKWPNGTVLKVTFMDPKLMDVLRKRVLDACNSWDCGVRFAELNGAFADGDVRIKFDPKDGYWSYLGIFNKDISKNKPTMSLGNLSMNTKDEDFSRVVCHEAGHALGFLHEHRRKEIVVNIDREKAIKHYGGPPNGWPPEKVEAHVLTPLTPDETGESTPIDETSIMCYDLPGSIMKGGKRVRGGTRINARDAAFAKMVYPKK